MKKRYGKYRVYVYKCTVVFEQQQMFAKIYIFFVKISYTGNPGHIVLHALHIFKLFWFQENNFWKIHKINFIVNFIHKIFWNKFENILSVSKYSCFLKNFSFFCCDNCIVIQEFLTTAVYHVTHQSYLFAHVRLMLS